MIKNVFITVTKTGKLLHVDFNKNFALRLQA